MSTAQGIFHRRVPSALLAQLGCREARHRTTNLSVDHRLRTPFHHRPRSWLDFARHPGFFTQDCPKPGVSRQLLQLKKRDPRAQLTGGQTSSAVQGRTTKAPKSRRCQKSEENPEGYSRPSVLGSEASKENPSRTGNLSAQLLAWRASPQPNRLGCLELLRSDREASERELLGGPADAGPR